MKKSTETLVRLWREQKIRTEQLSVSEREDVFRYLITEELRGQLAHVQPTRAA